MLVKPLLSDLVKNEKLLNLYLRYLRLGREHYTKKGISTEIKAEKIRLLEKAIRRGCKLKSNLVCQLEQEFLRENLSLYLLLEPLAAWRYLATGKLPTSEAQMSDVLGNIISPLARLLMVLNDETPSTYLPMQSMLTALILLQMLQDKDVFLQKLKWRKKRQLSKLRGLCRDGSVILSVVKTKRVKYRLAVLLNSLVLLTEKYAKNEQPTIEFLDAVRIFVYSICQFLFVKKQTVTKKGI